MLDNIPHQGIGSHEQNHGVSAKLGEVALESCEVLQVRVSPGVRRMQHLDLIRDWHSRYAVDSPPLPNAPMIYTLASDRAMGIALSERRMTVIGAPR